MEEDGLFNLKDSVDTTNNRYTLAKDKVRLETRNL